MTRRRMDFGAIDRLPSGRWRARYTDPSGRRHTRTFATRGDASRHLAAVRADLDRGAWYDPSAGRERLATFADRWLSSRRVKGRPLAPRTVDLYRWQLDRHILPALGGIELRRLDATTIRSWHAGLTKGGGGRVGAAKVYRLLHAILATAVEDGEIPRNPCAIKGAGQESSPERPAVSIPQVYALAGAVAPRWRALILLAAFCGLRFGELAALTRERVDLQHHTVTVSASAARLRGGRRVVGPPKSEAGRRTVAIPPHIVDDLQEHMDRYASPGPCGLVFVGAKGGALREDNFGSAVWRPATRAIGLQGLHFHDLRGCAATLAAIGGATTAELMHRLGHARVDVAMRYQRATADRDAAIAAAISGLVPGAAVTAHPRRGTQRRVRKIS